MRKSNWIDGQGRKIVYSHVAGSTRGRRVEVGVFLPWLIHEPGTSIAGYHLATKSTFVGLATVKERHLAMLNTIRKMPKPNLPADF